MGDQTCPACGQEGKRSGVSVVCKDPECRVEIFYTETIKQ